MGSLTSHCDTYFFGTSLRKFAANEAMVRVPDNECTLIDEKIGAVIGCGLSGVLVVRRHAEETNRPGVARA